MSRLEELYRWFDHLTHSLPCLSAPQMHGLMLWTAAILIGGVCSLSSAEIALYSLIGQPLNTLRQRLREFYKDAKHKSGKKRREIDVDDCFAPMLRWVANCVQGDKIALALDASSIKDRFTLLCVSVVVKGGAVPVAWRVVRAQEPGAWKPHWLELLDKLKGVIEPSRTVIVTADRGLFAGWLYKKVVELEWHPFLRINAVGNFTPKSGSEALIWHFIPPEGSFYASAGQAFRGERRLTCTLTAYNEKNHEPLLILTDLPPEQCEPFWYLMRFSIERQFKTLKSGCMQLQRTRMTEPARFERMLLPCAIALLYEISTGSAYEDDQPDDYNLTRKQRTPQPAKRSRRHSLARMGAGKVRADLLSGTTLVQLKITAEQWPSHQFCNST